MAKVESNPVVREIRGKIGNLVFRQMPGGETYVSSTPNFGRRKFSQGQKDHQSRFKRAAAYAREAAKTQPIYAELAKGTVKSAYNFALSDWFEAPVIHRIERKDGQIRVEASDNVLVAKVVVMILDDEGKVLEKGNASKVDERLWQYTCVNEGKVLAEAWDLAGNVVKRTELYD
ncbi:MAG: hypothetical protein JNM02_07330 [Anaerolineales bacterium]|nr:hypothetical protein [Anaerolineales bacterium]